MATLACRPHPSSRPVAEFMVIVVSYGTRQPRHLPITRSRRAHDALFYFVHQASSLSRTVSPAHMTRQPAASRAPPVNKSVPVRRGTSCMERRGSGGRGGEEEEGGWIAVYGVRGEVKKAVIHSQAGAQTSVSPFRPATTIHCLSL
jgi:hypothetical protein